MADIITQDEPVVLLTPQFKTTALLNQRFTAISRQKVDCKAAIGLPFDSVFQMKQCGGGNSRHTFRLVHLPGVTSLTQTEERDVMVAGDRDNRNLNDDGSSQALDYEEIERLKAEGMRDQALVDHLVANSKTFDAKTSFSKAKYRRKKEAKYGSRVKICRPSIQLMWEQFSCSVGSLKDNKICQLRLDTVAQMVSYVDVQFGSRLLLVENCMGLVASALLERMGGSGSLMYIHSYQSNHASITKTHHGETRIPIIPAVCSAHHRQSMVDIPLAELTWMLVDEHSWPSRLIDWADSHPSEDFYSLLDGFRASRGEASDGSKSSSTTAAAASAPCERGVASSSDTAGADVACDDSGDSRSQPVAVDSKLERIIALGQAKRELWRGNYHGLLICASYRPWPLIEKLIPFVGPSRPVVIYSRHVEPLIECFDHMLASATFNAVRIVEPWMREHQVLPDRSHPFMRMVASGGYLLLATTVMDRTTPKSHIPHIKVRAHREHAVFNGAEVLEEARRILQQKGLATGPALNAEPVPAAPASAPESGVGEAMDVQDDAPVGSPTLASTPAAPLQLNTGDFAAGLLGETQPALQHADGSVASAVAGVDLAAEPHLPASVDHSLLDGVPPESPPDFVAVYSGDDSDIDLSWADSLIIDMCEESATSCGEDVRDVDRGESKEESAGIACVKKVAGAVAPGHCPPMALARESNVADRVQENVLCPEPEDVPISSRLRSRTQRSPDCQVATPAVITPAPAPKPAMHTMRRKGWRKERKVLRQLPQALQEYRPPPPDVERARKLWETIKQGGKAEAMGLGFNKPMYLHYRNITRARNRAREMLARVRTCLKRISPEDLAPDTVAKRAQLENACPVLSAKLVKLIERVESFKLLGKERLALELETSTTKGQQGKKQEAEKEKENEEQKSHHPQSLTGLTGGGELLSQPASPSSAVNLHSGEADKLAGRLKPCAQQGSPPSSWQTARNVIRRPLSAGTNNQDMRTHEASNAVPPQKRDRAMLPLALPVATLSCSLSAPQKPGGSGGSVNVLPLDSRSSDCCHGGGASLPVSSPLVFATSGSEAMLGAAGANHRGVRPAVPRVEGAPSYPYQCPTSSGAGSRLESSLPGCSDCLHTMHVISSLCGSRRHCTGHMPK